MAKGKIVELTAYSPEIDGTDVQVKGRLLGFLRPKDFAEILSSFGSRSRAFNRQTMPLSELVGVEDIEGFRLAISIRERDGEEVFGKKLFVTEPLDMISSFGGDHREAQISGKKMYYILAEED